MKRPILLLASMMAATSIAAAEIKVLSAGAVEPGLRAFAQVAPRFTNAYLLIAGDGSRRTALEAEARTLGIADRVQFLGWQKDTSTLLASLDILLMPSRARVGCIPATLAI